MLHIWDIVKLELSREQQIEKILNLKRNGELETCLEDDVIQLLTLDDETFIVETKRHRVRDLPSELINKGIPKLSILFVLHQSKPEVVEYLSTLPIDTLINHGPYFAKTFPELGRRIARREITLDAVFTSDDGKHRLTILFQMFMEGLRLGDREVVKEAQLHLDSMYHTSLANVILDDLGLAILRDNSKDLLDWVFKMHTKITHTIRVFTRLVNTIQDIHTLVNYIHNRGDIVFARDVMPWVRSDHNEWLAVFVKVTEGKFDWKQFQPHFLDCLHILLDDQV